MRPPTSRFSGGLRVGATFFDERGALADPGDAGDGADAPRGVVDRIAELAGPGLAPERVHPAITAFFEDTASLDLYVRSEWRFPRLWRLVRPILRAIGQFVLPVHEAHIRTRVVRLAEGRDGRDAARAVLRTYAGSGEVMQAVAYATLTRGDERFMSAAFPMPGGHVLGILRLEAVTTSEVGEIVCVALTSEPAASRGRGPVGVWLVLAGLAVRSPFGERLALSAPRDPEEAADWDATRGVRFSLVGRHEQSFLGLHFVTHRYGFAPRGRP
ncbi:MAG: hypothetical protein IPF92_07365 [Myxococcales bacterium]|nr:hypothetical protein [Myxococcales bacterium]